MPFHKCQQRFRVKISMAEKYGNSEKCAGRGCRRHEAFLLRRGMLVNLAILAIGGLNSCYPWIARMMPEDAFYKAEGSKPPMSCRKMPSTNQRGSKPSMSYHLMEPSRWDSQYAFLKIPMSKGGTIERRTLLSVSRCHSCRFGGNWELV